MGYTQKRKLIRVGESSRAVILPKGWLDFHGEDANELTLLGDAVLVIAPKGLEGKARKMLERAEEGDDKRRNKRTSQSTQGQA